MSPVAKKTIITLVAAALTGVAMYLPAAAPVKDLLIALAGIMSGGAHLQRPGDVKA